MLDCLTQEQAIWVSETITKIENKMELVAKRSENKIPAQALGGVHDDMNHDENTLISRGISRWTNGFWGGILWQMYHHTGKEFYKEIAYKNEIMLDEALDIYLGLHHDVGFMWLPTSVASFRTTGNPNSRRRALHVANLLAGRFNPKGFIRAWNDGANLSETSGWAIIDCMYNIPLLHWASSELGDPRFSMIANIHADTVGKVFIRADGSSRHIVEFDPNTGLYLDDFGGQGKEKGSSWTRGQSWALAGFMINYRNSSNPMYLAIAQKIAEYFISNIPKDGKIPTDFWQAKEDKRYDDIAAGVASGALIELAKEVPLEATKYMNAALLMLKNLDETSDWSLETDGIVQNCSGSYAALDCNVNFTYGDYYFIEAMLKLNETEFPMWMNFSK